MASPPGKVPVAAGSPPPETPGAGTPSPPPTAKGNPAPAGGGANAADEGAAGEGSENPALSEPNEGAGKPGEGTAPPLSPAERDDVASAETVVLSGITEPPRRNRFRRQAQKRNSRPERDHSEPSWGKVLATTLRLWTQRRLARLRPHSRSAQRTQQPRSAWAQQQPPPQKLQPPEFQPPEQPKPARRRWRLVAWLILVALFVAFAAAVTLGQPHSTQQPAESGGAHNSGAAARALAAKARLQAAEWVSHEVSTDAIVACDPAMCAALQAQNVPASRVLVVRPGRGDPLGSDVLLATQAIRNQFGARLAGVYAPVVLAAFGAGAARVDIRVVAPDGTRDYLAALAADVKARVTVGSQVAHNPRIQTTATARAQLSAGLVDSRLLSTLAVLAAQHRLELIGFGDLPGPAASPGVALRSAVIAWAPRPGRHHKATLRSLVAFLQSQRPPYRPLVVKEVTSTAHRTVLRVAFSAPSPLGLLGSRS